jgi:hypothetical protein
VIASVRLLIWVLKKIGLDYSFANLELKLPTLIGDFSERFCDQHAVFVVQPLSGESVGNQDVEFLVADELDRSRPKPHVEGVLLDSLRKYG